MRMVRRNESRVRGARVVPWAVLVVGLATTGVLYSSIFRAIARRRDSDFKVARESLVDDMNAIVDRQVSMLHAAAGLVEANPNLTQSQFSTFYHNLRFTQTQPEAIGLSLWRPWERRGELAEEARSRGVKGFQPRPLDPRPEAHAVMLIAPLDKPNEKAFGFDMHAEPLRRDAMEAAKRDHVAVMTKRVSLAKDEGKPDQPSVIIYLPVWEGDGSRLLGFVYCGLHTQALFSGLFPRHEGMPEGDPLHKGLGLRLWSGEVNDHNLLFNRDVPEKDSRVLRSDVQLASIGRPLVARFVATPEFGAQSVIMPWIAPVGSVLSVLLFALAVVLRQAHENSERRAVEQELMAAAGRLTFDNANDDALAALALETAATLGAVCRIDLLEEDGSLRSVNTRTGSNEVLAELEREYPRLANDVVLQRAIAEGVTQRALQPSPRDDRHRELLDRLDLGPVTIVPMRSRDHAIGALTLSRGKGKPELARDAVALAEAVADRVALAVDNARLQRATQQEIEERRAAEGEVRRLNEGLEEIVTLRTRDLEASNKELESFCYSVSHDLRTPLRSLDGFGRALKEDYGEQLDEQAHDYIDRIRASTKRMDELITALLTLSRLTRREIVPTEVDVSAMARDLLHDLDPEGRVETRIADGVHVQADPRMLSVALENLLANAVKFSSRVEAPRIEVGATEGGEVYVRDNGAGFDPAYGAKLFQPFERLHSIREFPGHGIGLATVERILSRHGGTVRAEGNPGEGATFHMKFPT